MARGLGQRFHSNLLNRLFGKAPDATPAGIIFLAAWEGDPGADGQSGVEANGVNAAAIPTAAVDWSVATIAVPSVTDNLSLFQFPTAGAGGWNSGANFTHIALWDSLTARLEANYLGRGLMTVPKPVLEGDRLEIPIGDLTVQITETP